MGTARVFLGQHAELLHTNDSMHGIDLLSSESVVQNMTSDGGQNCGVERYAVAACLPIDLTLTQLDLLLGSEAIKSEFEKPSRTHLASALRLRTRIHPQYVGTSFGRLPEPKSAHPSRQSCILSFRQAAYHTASTAIFPPESRHHGVQ